VPTIYLVVFAMLRKNEGGAGERALFTVATANAQLIDFI
jgi:hypothetical protein